MGRKTSQMSRLARSVARLRTDSPGGVTTDSTGLALRPEQRSRPADDPLPVHRGSRVGLVGLDVVVTEQPVVITELRRRGACP